MSAIVIKAMPLETSFYNGSKKRIYCFERWANEEILACEPLLLAYNGCAIGLEYSSNISLRGNLVGFTDITNEGEVYIWDLVNASYYVDDRVSDGVEKPSQKAFDLCGNICSSQYQSITDDA